MESTSIALAIVTIILALRTLTNRPNPGRQLAHIERKLDMILQSLGLDAVEPVDSEVRALAEAGRKIDAIKLYREKTGVGLREAKTSNH